MHAQGLGTVAWRRQPLPPGDGVERLVTRAMRWDDKMSGRAGRARD